MLNIQIRGYCSYSCLTAAQTEFESSQQADGYGEPPTGANPFGARKGAI